MGYLASTSFSFPNPICAHNPNLTHNFPSSRNSLVQISTAFRSRKSHFSPHLALDCVNGGVNALEEETEKPKYKWVKLCTEEQNRALSQVSSKMSNRCKALMKQIICFSVENGSVSLMLDACVKSTNPQRADWLSILKELDRLAHPLFFEVSEYALTEESFEANIRDYTKMIHNYAKQDNLQEAEQALFAMKKRGFICDQVTLTALIHMYSKSGNLKMAQDSFHEMKLLGVPLDKRSYGSMIMAYIRSGNPDHGEKLLQEMEGKEVNAGREVYKALLRTYSMMGDSKGAQRIFDKIQLAGINPDEKICGLLINAYVLSGLDREARLAFDNMRKAGLEGNDKCVALVLAAYEKENKLEEGLNFLIELEKESSFLLGKEASELLVKWFRKLGVVEEIELVLRDFVSRTPQPSL